MARQMGGLWQHHDFMKLWTGETISLFGSEITTLALPLTAVLLLGATPAEMGVLGAASFAPFLLVTLFAGVWLDRRVKRPVLIATNFARALLIGFIPLAGLAGILTMELLYVLVFLAGTMNILFELAYQTYLPALLERDDLTDGNSKVFASASVAQIAGPGLGGWLVQLLTAPVALLVDAVTFLFAAANLMWIRSREAPPTAPPQREPLIRQIVGGLRLTVRNPYLRVFVGEAATYNFFNTAFATLLVLHLTETLHFAPAMIGAVFMAGSVGALLGSIVTARAAKRIGIGRAIMFGGVFSCLSPLLVPLADGALALPVIMVGYFLAYFGTSFTNVHTFTIRQAIMPKHLRGRMTASYRFISWGVLPLGALMMGAIGETFGVRATLWVGALGLATTALWFFVPPIPSLRAIPDPIEDDETEPAVLLSSTVQP